jgi:tRNA threonylcarbamoyladenosine biosynthesis protein TsaB
VKLLAIESAGDACSVALSVDESCLERHLIAPRQHAQLLLSLIQALLDEAGLALAGLDVLAFGRGPGSFTGVRIAAGVIQGLAYGADLPVVPVSSLQALAQGALRERASTRVLAAFDARLGEVYWGAYEEGRGGLMAVHTDDIAATPEAVPPPGGSGWLGAGEGWRVYPRVLAERIGVGLAGTQPERMVRAMDVAALAKAAHARGDSVDAGAALPVYVRNKVARKRGEQARRISTSPIRRAHTNHEEIEK